MILVKNPIFIKISFKHTSRYMYEVLMGLKLGSISTGNKKKSIAQSIQRVDVEKKNTKCSKDFDTSSAHSISDNRGSIHLTSSVYRTLNTHALLS